MSTFSCSFQVGSWRLGCRGSWCFQQLPVETATLFVMYCKIGLLLAWEVCTEPKPSQENLSRDAEGLWLSCPDCCSNWDQRERITLVALDTKVKGAGWKQEAFCWKEWKKWWKEHQTEQCPSRSKKIQMGIFLLGTRQDYTKSEMVRRG